MATGSARVHGRQPGRHLRAARLAAAKAGLHLLIACRPRQHPACKCCGCVSCPSPPKPGARGTPLCRHPKAGGTLLHTASGVHRPDCCQKPLLVIHATHTFLLSLLLQLAVALIDGRLPRVHQLHCTAPRAQGACLQQQREKNQWLGMIMGRVLDQATRLGSNCLESRLGTDATSLG